MDGTSIERATGLDDAARGRWSPGWPRAALALALVWLAIGGLYRETLVVMVGVWAGSETFTHAFLVPVISAWLVWRLRPQIQTMTPRPAPWVLAPMALLSALWLAGDMMLVNSATQFAVVGLLVLAVPLVLGGSLARALMFPLGFLFFAVPFGDFLLPVMMENTADFTVAALKLSGIPVYREGLQFVIPSGNWSVVEACSGVRYLIASVMVGTLFAYLNYHTPWKRWVFVGVSILMPIVANWLRAYMIVMLGHLSDNTIAVGVDHLIYGWVFFGIVIAAMFYVGGRWAELDAPVPEAAPGATAAGDAPVRSPWLACLVGVVLCATAPLASQAMQRVDLDATAPVLELPRSLAGLPRTSDALQVLKGWSPIFGSPRAAAASAYSDGTNDAALHVAYFRGQDYRSKLVSSVHALSKPDDSSWNLQSQPPVRVQHRGREVVLTVTRLSAPPQLAAQRAGMWLVMRGYWVDGEFESSALRAKLLNASARLRGRGDDGAVVMVAVHGDATAEDAQRARLERMAAAALADLDASLQAVRARR